MTNRSGTSLCACPNSTASIPGTCSATIADAFSTGMSPWYEDIPLSPACAVTITTSAPSRRITGTQKRTDRTRSVNRSLPSTLARSQIAMPGLVSPSTPTFTGRFPLTFMVFSTNGRYVGSPVRASTAFAPSTGAFICLIQVASSGRP